MLVWRTLLSRRNEKGKFFFFFKVNDGHPLFVYLVSNRRK